MLTTVEEKENTKHEARDDSRSESIAKKIPVQTTYLWEVEEF